MTDWATNVCNGCDTGFVGITLTGAAGKLWCDRCLAPTLFNMVADRGDAA